MSTQPCQLDIGAALTDPSYKIGRCRFAHEDYEMTNTALIPEDAWDRKSSRLRCEWAHGKKLSLISKMAAIAEGIRDNGKELRHESFAALN